MTKAPKRLDFSLYLRREPVTLALLTVLAVVAFVAVTGLSRTYDAQQTSLAERWSGRGMADLKVQNFPAAVNDFRTALLYSRDNYSYQLNLAEALIGQKRINEAYAYLINLWDREPENGVVNLELARIYADRKDTNQALRFYHNAIYATWPGDQEAEMRSSRLELIHYLLHINALSQAQAELIALAANVGENSEEQAHLGDLLLQAQGYEHALDAFRESLRADRHNQEAMMGAGIAAFQLGLYPTAQRYLRAAVRASPRDAESATWLKKTNTVLAMDPFRAEISEAERNRIVINAFTTAGNRLKACTAQGGAAAPTAAEQGLAQEWTKLKPRITEWRLRRNPDLANTAMDLAFKIERQVGSECGAPTEADQALLLIAKLHAED